MNEEKKKSIALVFGNTGGIGRSIFESLVSSKKYCKVFGLNRSYTPYIDVTNEDNIKELASNLIEKDLSIELLFNATGYLHDNSFSPEKKIQDINLHYMRKSFEINTYANALLIKHLAPLMKKESKSIFASLSARVGSISDNFLGGWYSYRASKAALNQIIKTASIEFKIKNKNLIFVAIHPGTVYTKLSKPFAGNKTLMSCDESAKKILSVINNLTIEDSGYLIDYKNQKIQF